MLARPRSPNRRQVVSPARADVEAERSLGEFHQDGRPRKDRCVTVVAGVEHESIEPRGSVPRSVVESAVDE